jgi:NodT family efflux transporter outer membrane factor (OMF) lipoprotein
MSHLLHHTSRAALAVGALGLLAGCAVGPDFARPAAPSSVHYDVQAEQGPRIALGRHLSGDWWAAFRSPRLDAVMRQAIAGNLDLAAADATIAQAREATAGARGALAPQLDFGAAGGRERALSGDVVYTSNFYAVGPQVSFDFDAFGGIKRSIEQRAALAEFQQHRFDAAWLTLTGDVARQALLLASARAGIDAVQTLLAQDRKTLAIVEAAHAYGSATQVDVALAKTQLAQDETLLPPLAQQRDTARHALSVLGGKGPADQVPPDFDLDEFALPAQLPVSLPSDLARDRPDILAAEAQLHAASAAIGVATADLYPRLQLSGAFAAAGPGTGPLWSVAAGLTAPLFHGGTLQANRRAAVDAWHAAFATYRQTVVRALGQVADVLQAIDHDGEAAAAQQRALDAAAASLRLNQQGYAAGETGVLHVLDAQRAYQRALLGWIGARTAQQLDTVHLSVALGGGASTRTIAFNTGEAR